MKHPKPHSVAIALGGALAVTAALAQTTSPSATPSPSPSASASAAPLTVAQQLDANQAVNLIHHVNNLEIMQASSATGLLQSQSAINYAQELVTDHQQNEQQLQQLATQLNLPLFGFQPSTVDNAQLSALSQVGASDYDASFLQLEQEDHQTAIQQLQTLQGKVSNPQLTAFIAQTIALLQKHLQQAGAGGVATASPSPSVSPSASATP